MARALRRSGSLPSGWTRAPEATARSAQTGRSRGRASRASPRQRRRSRAATSAAATCSATRASSSRRARASRSRASSSMRDQARRGDGAHRRQGRRARRLPHQGAGNVTVNGKFFEDKSPGIQGVRQLVVSSGGSLVGMVEQPPEKTAFGFEPGCKLRMKINGEAKTHAGEGRDAVMSTSDAKRRRWAENAGRGRDAIQRVALLEVPDRGKGARRGGCQAPSSEREPEGGGSREGQGGRARLARGRSPASSTPT